MFEIDQIIALGFFICLLGITLFMAIISTSSCGGRENCGKKYCVIGIMMDSIEFLIMGFKLLLLLEAAVIVAYILDL